MAQIIALWNSLSYAEQFTVALGAAGFIQYWLQKAWTHSNLPWVFPDSPARRKKAAAAILSLATSFIAAASTGHFDMRMALAAAVAAFLGSQATASIVRGNSAPCPPEATK